MDEKLNLPYITEGLEGIGGIIRKKPEHFRVIEIPVYEPCKEGKHLFLNITKKNITTKELQKKIARIFNIHEKHIGIAGLKDKNALTTQTFSLSLEKIKLNKEEILNKIKEELDCDYEINSAEFHKNKLRTGHLLGNKFSIIISDLEIDKDKALKRTEKIINKIKKTGLPNYYGEQRFGIENRNIGKGLDLIKGNLRIRDKWLKRFLISSYQSYLCNQYLAKRVNSGIFNKLIKGDVAKKYDTGGLFLVEDLKTDQLRYEKKEISFTAPIFGRKMFDSNSDAREFEESILDEELLSLKDLENAKVEGTRRLGRLLIDDIKARICEEGIEVEFSLPKGAFATIVLREIMKN